MRHLLTFALICLLAGSATAMDLGSTQPVVHKDPTNVFMDGAADREGGENIASAVMIASLPYSDTGATCDNVNDYDEVCPYSGSLSPDVVYGYTAAADGFISVDLYGSGYDTKTYVYDAAGSLIACNDDFYSDYVSFIEAAPVSAGTTYYIVIDGYGSACGSYSLTVDSFTPPPPCEIVCDGVAEGEPGNGPNYVDEYNSGCNGVEGNFQALTADENGNLTVCGVAGWNGLGTRDTDWYMVIFGEGGVITWSFEAEQESYFFELAPQDCATVGVAQSSLVSPCNPDVLILNGAAGSVAWVWAGASTYDPPVGFVGYDYNYKMEFSGLEPGIIATEATTFDSIKSMYR